jgi:hypothetical protein
MSKKKISKFEKQWKEQRDSAKEFGWDFSLPLKPVLGEGGAWTPAKLKAVNGRIVTVGWGDSPESIGVAFFNKRWGGEPHLLCFDGTIENLWGPETIISIGERLDKVINK